MLERKGGGASKPAQFDSCLLIFVSTAKSPQRVRVTEQMLVVSLIGHNMEQLQIRLGHRIRQSITPRRCVLLPAVTPNVPFIIIP